MFMVFLLSNQLSLETFCRSHRSSTRHWQTLKSIWCNCINTSNPIQWYIRQNIKISEKLANERAHVNQQLLRCDWFIVCILQAVISKSFNMCECATNSAKKKIKKKKIEMNMNSGIKITMDANVHGETHKF